MSKIPNRARANAPLTVGEVEDLLNSLYDRLSVALRDPPDGQLDAIVSALNIIEWTLDEIIKQDLHHDAVILGRLADELKGPTDQLVKLKNDLQQLAQVAALGAALLNTIGSVLPLL